MVLSADRLPLASLIFVSKTEDLFLRVKNGFRQILLGSSVTLATRKPTVPPTRSIREAQKISKHFSSHYIDRSEEDALHLIAANHPVSGSMTGISGADHVCYREARDAGWRTTFIAFLASRLQNIDSLVHSGARRLPVVNAKNELLFESWVSMFNGSGTPFNVQVPIYSFSGRDVLTDSTWLQKNVWLGSDPRGVRLSHSFCRSWTSDRPHQFGTASSLLRGRLLDGQRQPCASPFVLLCVELTPDVDLVK